MNQSNYESTLRQSAKSETFTDQNKFCYWFLPPNLFNFLFIFNLILGLIYFVTFEGVLDSLTFVGLFGEFENSVFVKLYVIVGSLWFGLCIFLFFLYILFVMIKFWIEYQLFFLRLTLRLVSLVVVVFLALNVIGLGNLAQMHFDKWLKDVTGQDGKPNLFTYTIFVCYFVGELGYVGLTCFIFTHLYNFIYKLINKLSIFGSVGGGEVEIRGIGFGTFVSLCFWICVHVLSAKFLGRHTMRIAVERIKRMATEATFEGSFGKKADFLKMSEMLEGCIAQVLVIGSLYMAISLLVMILRSIIFYLLDLWAKYSDKAHNYDVVLTVTFHVTCLPQLWVFVCMIYQEEIAGLLSFIGLITSTDGIWLIIGMIRYLYENGMEEYLVLRELGDTIKPNEGAGWKAWVEFAIATAVLLANTVYIRRLVVISSISILNIVLTLKTSTTLVSNTTHTITMYLSTMTNCFKGFSFLPPLLYNYVATLIHLCRVFQWNLGWIMKATYLVLILTVQTLAFTLMLILTLAWRTYNVFRQFRSVYAMVYVVTIAITGGSSTTKLASFFFQTIHKSDVFAQYSMSAFEELTRQLGGGGWKQKRSSDKRKKGAVPKPPPKTQPKHEFSRKEELRQEKHKGDVGANFNCFRDAVYEKMGYRMNRFKDIVGEYKKIVAARGDFPDCGGKPNPTFSFGITGKLGNESLSFEIIAPRPTSHPCIIESLSDYVSYGYKGLQFRGKDDRDEIVEATHALLVKEAQSFDKKTGTLLYDATLRIIRSLNVGCLIIEPRPTGGILEFTLVGSDPQFIVFTEPYDSYGTSSLRYPGQSKWAGNCGHILFLHSYVRIKREERRLEKDIEDIDDTETVTSNEGKPHGKCSTNADDSTTGNSEARNGSTSGSFGSDSRSSCAVCRRNIDSVYVLCRPCSMALTKDILKSTVNGVIRSPKNTPANMVLRPCGKPKFGAGAKIIPCQNPIYDVMPSCQSCKTKAVNECQRAKETESEESIPREKTGSKESSRSTNNMSFGAPKEEEARGGERKEAQKGKEIPEEVKKAKLYPSLFCQLCRVKLIGKIGEDGQCVFTKETKTLVRENYILKVCDDCSSKEEESWEENEHNVNGLDHPDNGWLEGGNELFDLSAPNRVIRYSAKRIMHYLIAVVGTWFLLTATISSFITMYHLSFGISDCLSQFWRVSSFTLPNLGLLLTTLLGIAASPGVLVFPFLAQFICVYKFVHRFVGHLLFLLGKIIFDMRYYFLPHIKNEANSWSVFLPGFLRGVEEMPYLEDVFEFMSEDKKMIYYGVVQFITFLIIGYLFCTGYLKLRKIDPSWVRAVIRYQGKEFSVKTEKGTVQDNGFYELYESTYLKPMVSSIADNSVLSPHSFRFLMWDVEIADNNAIYLFREIYSAISPQFSRFLPPSKGRLPIGHVVPWREGHTFGSEALIYKNCGPLNPMTAWNVWFRFSGNDPMRPVVIAWDKDMDANDTTVRSNNNFGFPYYESYKDGYYYSWERVTIEVRDVNGVSVYSGFSPTIQVSKSKLPLVSDTSTSMMTHFHTFQLNVTPTNPMGDYVVKECKCNDQCIEPTGSYAFAPPLINQNNPTNGLWSEDFVAVMTHLMAQTDENAQDSIGQYLMSKPSYNRNGRLFTRYTLSLLKEREIMKASLININLIPLKGNQNRGITKAPGKGDLYQRCPGRTKVIEVPDVMVEFDSERYSKYAIGGRTFRGQWTESKKERNAKDWRRARMRQDESLANLIIDGVVGKYGLSKSLVYDTLIAYSSSEIGGRCFGESVKEPVPRSTSGGLYYSKITCNVCKQHPPLKFKWPQSICPRCHDMMRLDVSVPGIKEHLETNEGNWRKCASRLSYVVKYGFTDLIYPTPILCAEPKYKPKPLREGMKNEELFSWKSIGFRSPKRTTKAIEQNSSPSWINGLTAIRRATCLNIKSIQAELNTIKVRLFAKPETSPKQGIFEGLFEFAVKYNLIGDAVPILRPMPLFPYNFTREGWLAESLIQTKVSNEKNLGDHLIRIKKNVDWLNLTVFQLDDWKEGHDRLYLGRYWFQGFEARKKAGYFRNLLSLNLDYKENRKDGLGGEVLPRVTFSFFLKRELSPHTCSMDGNRASANPRVICNPDGWTQIVMGPFTKALTERLHSLWGEKFTITYFGGLPPGGAENWLHDVVSSYKMFKPQFEVAIENDFSKFDCTYSLECFEFLAQVYKYWGWDLSNSVVNHVWQGWMRPCGRFRSGLCVSAAIMNASGRSDTALMNALVNGLVQVASYCMAEQNVDTLEDLDEDAVRRTLQEIRIGVLGDDSLTLYKYFPDMTTLVGDKVALFGFEARDMKLHMSPENMVFLAQRPYPVVDEFGGKSVKWGPTMRRLNKMGISESKQPSPYKWVYQTSIATLIMSSFVPYISDIAKKQLELISDHRFLRDNNILELDSVKHKMQFMDEDFVDVESWQQKWFFDNEYLEHWLHHTYGASLEDYYRFLDVLGDVESPVGLIGDRALERMISMDTGT